jgi:hypothetical protein
MAQMSMARAGFSSAMNAVGCVVVFAPLPDGNLRFLQVIEDVLVEAFVS